MDLYNTLKVASCILFSCVLFLVLASISSIGSKLSLDPSKELQMQTRFLYLLQTESCIPKHLITAETIGNDSMCQCDILVLGFKSVCNISGCLLLAVFSSESFQMISRDFLLI